MKINSRSLRPTDVAWPCQSTVSVDQAAMRTVAHRADTSRTSTLIVALLLVFLSSSFTGNFAVAQTASVQPVAHAHAHNDYLHQRPLHDALDHGFNSVEADIFLVDGKLLVAHTQLELKKDRTLEALYLEPLKKRVAENDGRVYKGGPTFGLLIDIKSEAESTFKALHETLAKYSAILSSVTDGVAHPGAISVVISGNRPKATIAAQSVRYCGIDGRLEDLDSQQPSHLLPMISDNWTNHFKWRGQGPMPEAEKQKLLDIVRRSHEKQRVVRFWATPESKPLWAELADADVDLINTDRLAELESFLRQR